MIAIGYWKSSEKDPLPNPEDRMSGSISDEDRENVIAYLRRGMVARAWMGYARCRVCGVQLGSCDLTDGIYVWPEGFDHYLLEHGVIIPRVFVEHVNMVRAQLEDEAVDFTWWVEIGVDND